MDLIEQCYSYLFWGALVVLAMGILGRWCISSGPG